MDEIKSESKVILLSHGNMCEAAIQTAKMIGLTDENFITIPMDELVALEEYEAKIRATLSSVPEGSLILVDVFGGTPFNIICKVMHEFSLFGIAGFNLPMILEAWCASKFMSGVDLQQEVLNAGKNGIKDMNCFLKNMILQNETDELGEL